MLVVQHVRWEGPHRIGVALERAGFGLDLRHVLDGDPLPSADEVVGAVFMGGPMNVDETAKYPALADERAWLNTAINADLPVLGICLGSQLIARALGARVEPGIGPEIGWAHVDVSDPDDPIVGGLAPHTDVLHWHGDVFDLPPGATHLASSSMTAIQAFRYRNAWGMLFHAEADLALTQLWLDEPAMAEEARGAVGEDGPQQLLAQAADSEAALIERSTPGFNAFADVITGRLASSAA